MNRDAIPVEREQLYNRSFEKLTEDRGPHADKDFDDLQCSRDVWIWDPLTFVPQELPLYCGTTPQPVSVLMVQAAGALYLGFAILNWVGKEKAFIYLTP